MKQKWKKPLSWLLALSMVFTMLPAMGISAKAADETPTRSQREYALDVTQWPGGVDGYYDREGWKWDAHSKVLTLDNVDFNIPAVKPNNVSAQCGIYVPDGSTIELIGTNEVVSYEGSGAQENIKSAIYGRNLTIVGDGTLNITTSDICGIMTSEKLTIGDEKEKTEIHVKAPICISASQLSLVSGSVEVNGSSCGVSAGELLDIAKDFEIKAAMSTLDEDVYACKFGMKEADRSPWDDPSTTPDPTYPWSKASIEASVENGVVTEHESRPHIVYVKQTDLDTPVTLNYKGDIGSAEDTPSDGLDFTKMDTTDKLSTDGWKWDKENNTLTLDSANISASAGIVEQIWNPYDAAQLATQNESAILLPDGATIQVNGENTVTFAFSSVQKDTRNMMAICGSDLTFIGSGKLNVTTKPAESMAADTISDLSISGIACDETLTIGDADGGPALTATAAGSSRESIGIEASELVLEHGSINAHAGQPADVEDVTSVGIFASQLNKIADGFQITAFTDDETGFACFFMESNEAVSVANIKNSLQNGEINEEYLEEDLIVITQKNHSEPVTFTYSSGSVTPTTYDVTVTTNNGDWGLANADPSTAAAGQTVTLSTKATEGYQFKEWKVESGNVEKIEDNKFTMPAGNVEIQAVFEEIPTTPTDKGYTLDDGKLTIKNDDGMAAWIAFVQNPTGMYNVTSIEIQDGVTYIGEGVFAGLTNIESITIPASVKRIGDNAFLDCSRLATVTVLGTAPASLGADVFKGTKFVNDNTPGITVPSSTLFNYQDSWSAWKDYMQENGGSVAPATYTVTVTTNNGDWGSASADKTADLKEGDTVTLSASAKSGYHFKEWQVKDGDVKSIENNQFKMPAGNVTIQAVFEKDSTGGSSSGSHSSSSSSSSSSYGIDVPSKTAGGNVAVTPKNASKGTTVTITATPDKGYTLKNLTVLDKDGKTIKLTEKNGKYTFTMPAGKVSIKADFAKDTASETPEQSFSDVSAADYYFDAVKWAADKGITGGVGNGLFAPEQSCTRAQIVTFLWRAAGSPEPKALSSFTDVPADAYYAKAVAWAVENGITVGTSETTFGPNETCTRAHGVTFLYRASKAAAVSGTTAFTDVAENAYYANAVKWAVDNGITNGMSSALFGSDNDCTRAQIVTFLFRAYNK